MPVEPTGNQYDWVADFLTFFTILRPAAEGTAGGSRQAHGLLQGRFRADEVRRSSTIWPCKHSSVGSGACLAAMGSADGATPHSADSIAVAEEEGSLTLRAVRRLHTSQLFPQLCKSG